MFTWFVAEKESNNTTLYIQPPESRKSKAAKRKDNRFEALRRDHVESLRRPKDTKYCNYHREHLAAKSTIIMTETPIDLTHKEKTSFWSCFQVCFPIVPQRPPASSAKSRKTVSFAPAALAAQGIDLRELEACLDNESPQKQEPPVSISNTAEETPSSAAAKKNHSTLTEFWHYIITFCVMGFMSCFQANNRRSITASAESTEHKDASNEPKNVSDEPKIVAVVS